MKFLKGYVVTLLKSVIMIFALIGVVSCQKNKNDDNPIDPVGYWKGHYTQIGFLGQSKVNVLMKADGTARVYDMGLKTDTAALSGGSKSTATWTLNSGKLDVQYGTLGGLVVFTGTVDPVKLTWIGTWSAAGVNKGTIKLAKE